MKTSVLVTRPEPMASFTAAGVAALGLTPILAPLFDVKSVPVNLPPPDSVQGLLLTSALAIPPIPAAYHHLPVLAVGDATAERAREAGFTKVASAGADAQALADLAAKQFKPEGGPLLLAAREGLGEPMELDLNDRGFTVVRRTVYAIAPVSALPASARTALEAGTLGFAMFFSADTARAFVRLVQAAGLSDTVVDIDAVAIGKPAAVSLGALRWRSVRTAAHPTQDEMLALLQ